MTKNKNMEIGIMIGLCPLNQNSDKRNNPKVRIIKLDISCLESSSLEVTKAICSNITTKIIFRPTKK